MSLTTEAREPVAALLERAFRRPPVVGLISAYLFGSHAEQRAHRESDVDVGVLLDRAVHSTSRRRFDARVRLSSWLVGVLHCDDVDVVILNDAPPLLGRRIVAAGRRVFCTDPEADRTFTRDTQLRAADLEPFLRHTRRVKLAAIAR